MNFLKRLQHGHQFMIESNLKLLKKLGINVSSTKMDQTLKLKYVVSNSTQIKFDFEGQSRLKKIIIANAIFAIIFSSFGVYKFFTEKRKDFSLKPYSGLIIWNFGLLFLIAKFSPRFVTQIRVDYTKKQLMMKFYFHDDKIIKLNSLRKIETVFPKSSIIQSLFKATILHAGNEREQYYIFVDQNMRELKEFNDFVSSAR